MRNPLDSQNLALVTTPAVDLEAEADLARCGALKDFWYVACLSTELVASKPLARTIFGTPLVLFRDARRPAGGAARSLPAPQRAPVRGRRLRRALGCPYHGWVYDASGALRGDPLARAEPARCRRWTPRATRARACSCSPCDVGRLQRFETLEQDGLVFVFPGEDARERDARPSACRTGGEPGGPSTSW